MKSNEKVFVIVYRIINNSLEFLALKPNPEPNRNSNYYVVTGGVEKSDQSFESAALREVEEEIGVKGLEDVLDLEYSINYKDHITFIEYIEHCFGVKIGDEPILLNEEHIGYKWLGKDDFIKTIWWDYDKNILKKMINIIQKHENI